MVASLLIRRLMPEHHYIPLITHLSLPHILWKRRVGPEQARARIFCTPRQIAMAWSKFTVHGMEASKFRRRLGILGVAHDPRDYSLPPMVAQKHWDTTRPTDVVTCEWRRPWTPLESVSENQDIERIDTSHQLSENGKRKSRN